MDHRAWMYGIQRYSHTFMSEVSKFVKAAEKHAHICRTKQICCPCFDCNNNIRGFVDGYTIWSHPGEARDDDYDSGDQNGDQTDARVELQVDEERDVDMEDMLRHIEPKVLLGSAKGSENFETLKKVAKYCMYEGCGNEWTVLRFVLHLLISKAKFGWLDNSFNDLLTLLGKLLPKPNFVPKNIYEAKKIINQLKMRVQRIHACRNHCILYHGEYATLEKCPNCDASRYKNNADFCEDHAGSSIRNKRKKGAKKSVGAQVEDESFIGTDTTTRHRVPALVMWYLPVVDRLKRLFSNPKPTEMMTWHADCLKKIQETIKHGQFATLGNV
uniref:Transposase-associated domain-containing protein n=1 Tax=Setaria italica TaxID=4555 RepID=K3XRD4_SETIT